MQWTRAALEALVGETERLTREFKSCDALMWGDDRDRRKRLIAEAAKDVAAMAGGTIIYGIKESGSGTRRTAESLEDGFDVESGVSRECFLQTMRDNIHPMLSDLDAVDVQLDEERIALVVLVVVRRDWLGA